MWWLNVSSYFLRLGIFFQNPLLHSGHRLGSWRLLVLYFLPLWHHLFTLWKHLVLCCNGIQLFCFLYYSGPVNLLHNYVQSFLFICLLIKLKSVAVFGSLLLNSDLILIVHVFLLFPVLSVYLLYFSCFLRFSYWFKIVLNSFYLFIYVFLVHFFLVFFIFLIKLNTLH